MFLHSLGLFLYIISTLEYMTIKAYQYETHIVLFNINCSIEIDFILTILSYVRLFKCIDSLQLNEVIGEHLHLLI